MGSPSAAPLPVARLVGVGSVVFLANAALLILQLVAGRLLAPFVGSSLETWTSVIGVFLTGIALGNAFGGRLADKYPTPRTLAAVLAVGAIAALWMMLLPIALSTSGVYKAIPLGSRIPVLTILLCLPAGFVLSLLTPLAIKLGLPDVAHTGRVAGMVFALSTLGCLLGNYVTGFYLIPMFTINTLVLMAAGGLAVLSIGTFVASQAGEPATPNGEGTSPPGPLSHGERGNVSSSPSLSGKGDGGLGSALNPHAFPNIRRAYLIVFLASFGGMTLELTASRLLAEVLGVSLFTWTGIIGVMLAGTALGNFFGGVVADRVNRPGSTWNPRLLLATTFVAAGAVTGLMIVTKIVMTHSRILQAGIDELTLIQQVLVWTFALFFLPMFTLGMVSPQVIRLAVPDVAHVGRVAGRVYAWSTVGAIVGTFAAGYLLLSTLGVTLTVLGVTLILTIASFLIFRVWDHSPLLYLFSIVLGGIAGGLILVGRGHPDPDVLATLETNYYTIKVSKDPYRWGGKKLTLDHLVHSSVDPDDPLWLYYEHEHVQVEFLRAARLKTPTPKVLVIGGGGYTFPRAAKELFPETQLDVVEIDPGVTKIAREHLGLDDKYKINPVHMDGRQFVSEKAAPGTYDLIIQDAVNDLSVPAHLLTKEYNDAVKAALKPNGIYLLTVIDSLKYGKLWRSAVATLRKTFPEANVALLASTEKYSASERAVYVIYASDTPLQVRDLRTAVKSQLVPGFAAGTAVASFATTATAPGLWPPGMGTGLFPDAAALVGSPVHTFEVPMDELQKNYLDADPGVILTDQYAPVDNLMAELFRNRYKRMTNDE